MVREGVTTYRMTPGLPGARGDVVCVSLTVDSQGFEIQRPKREAVFRSIEEKKSLSSALRGWVSKYT